MLLNIRPVPAPTLTNLTITTNIKSITLKWDTNADPSYLSTQVFRGLNSTFGSAIKIADSAGGFFADDVPSLVTYYYWIRAVNIYNRADGVVTGSVSGQALASAPDADSITAAMVKQGVLDVTKFASSVAAPVVVAALPNPATYVDSKLVFLTTDGKLYRLVAGAWVTSVPTVDLTGTITDAQVAGVSAAKISGQLADTQVAALAASKITGQLSDTQLAAIAATKISGTLSDTQLAAISAAKITGTLSDTQLAAISAAKITGTLTDTQISALSAAKLTGTIVSTQITDGAISTPKIATGAITAGTIAAGAITTSALSVGTGRNLLRYSSWQQGTGIQGWALGYNTAAFTASPFTAVTPVIARRAAGDTYSFNGESGNMNYSNVAVNISGQTELNHGEQIGVMAGATYEASIYLLTHRCSAQISMVFYDVNGVATATNPIQSGNTVAIAGANNGNVLTNYNRSVIIGVAPPGAVKALVLIRCFYSNTLNPYLFFARAYFGEASPNQTTATPWSPSGVTQIDGAVITTGTVTAAQITAGSITGDRIAGTTITAGNIAAGAITAGKILAGTVTANEIAGNTITGANIAGNTITAGNLLAGTITANEIASATITGGKIAGATITAGNLQAGTITANEIASKSISADKLIIGNFSNMVDNPGFESGDVSWPLKEQGWYMLNAGLGNAYAGTWVAQMPPNKPTGALRNGNQFTISEGDVYYGKARILCNNTHSLGYIRMTLQNSTGSSEISIANSPVVTTANAWVLHEFNATITRQHIVDGYTKGRFEVVGTTNLTGWVATDGVAVDDCGMFRVSNSTLIQDGAITTTKMTANSITGDRITAGTLDANKITANSITAGQIQAGSITAAEIRSGAITTDKIAIGDTSNMCNNPDFELGDVGWIKTNGFTIRNTPDGANGPQSGNWFAAQLTPFNNATLRSVQFVPVNPGDVFYARAYLWSKTAGDTGYLRILGNDKNGGEYELATSPNGVQSGWSSVSCQTASPLPSYITKLRVEVVATVVSTGGGFYADGVGLFRVSSATLIQDGTITTTKIIASGISGDAITANTLNANRITANTITANQIAAGAITADRFQSGMGAANLLPNSSFAATSPDGNGRLQPDNWTYAPNGNNPALSYAGVNMFADRQPLQTQCFQCTTNGSAGTVVEDFVSTQVPVAASSIVEASAWVAQINCQIYFTLAFYDGANGLIGEYASAGSSAGTCLSTEASGYQPPNNTATGLGAFKRIFFLWGVPANAIYMVLRLRKSTPSGVQSNMFVCQPYLGYAASGSQSLPSPYAPSGIGTQISGGIIKTGTLSADKISARTITTDRLVIGSVTQQATTVFSSFSMSGPVTNSQIINFTTTGGNMMVSFTGSVGDYTTAGGKFDVYVDLFVNGPSVLAVNGLTIVTTNSNIIGHANISGSLIYKDIAAGTYAINLRISSSPSSPIPALIIGGNWNIIEMKV